MDSLPAPHSNLALYYHPAYLEHDTGQHPENADRLRGIISALARYGIPENQLHKPGPVDLDLLSNMHDARYIATIEKAARSGGGYWDYDTIISPDSYDAALLAAGAAAAIVDSAVLGASVPFALVRPPGHHALHASAMGFCIFNNVAVAAQHAIEKHGMERVMIVDWDVHHGNGTQDLFYNRPDVLFFSTHQYPFYPGTGALEETGSGEGKGFTLNVPLPGGVDDSGYREVFEQVLAPAAYSYKPQLILISAGYDAHVADPIGGMALTTAGFYELARFVRELSMDIAECGGRVAAVLEGGYNIEALAASVIATIAGLSPTEGSMVEEIGEAPQPPTNPYRWRRTPDISSIISSVKRIHHL